MFQAQSFPIVCNYDDNGLDVPDGLQSDVENLINRNHFQSSSSENEADDSVDSPSEMTILRPKITRRKIRISSDKSYGNYIFSLFIGMSHLVLLFLTQHAHIGSGENQ